MAKITMNLSKDEYKLKEMIQALGKAISQGNPYLKRSESEIAKMILEPTLTKEYQKYAKNNK
ncbi:MAG: hypothetical protein IMF10_08680 [Proteobacteria bacterium]|nr:hypothetical protein [Pseudomonadota bacterium]